MVEFFGPDRAGAPPRAQVDCTKANAVSSRSHALLWLQLGETGKKSRPGRAAAENSQSTLQKRLKSDKPRPTRYHGRNTAGKATGTEGTHRLQRCLKRYQTPSGPSMHCFCCQVEVAADARGPRGVRARAEDAVRRGCHRARYSGPSILKDVCLRLLIVLFTVVSGLPSKCLSPDFKP